MNERQRGAPGATPEVSVVMPTYQRRDLVRAQVAAVLDQEGVDHEVIVVDNGSTDGTAALLAELAADEPRLRVLRIEDNRGPAPARNAGWRASRAPWIAFTDDDCIVTRRWLAELLAAADGHDIVQGATLPLPADQHHTSAWSKSQRITAETVWFETCNLGVRRGLLAAVDGFDEVFPVAAGEDTDLGWRALESGATLTFAPDAVVHHRVWPRTFGEFLRERPRWAEAVLVVKRHPQVRRHLAGRVFYRWAHAVVVVGIPLVLVASATVGWWLAPAALGGWVAAYVFRSRRRGWPLRTRALRALQTLVAAAWETVLCARASIRHRTLVL